jgi:hypothetical protein
MVTIHSHPLIGSTTLHLSLVPLDDIEALDAFVGGAAEDSISGSLYGPTMSLVLCGTFQRLRQHDPLFFEADGMFTAEGKACACS